MAAPDEPGSVKWTHRVGDRFERRVQFPWALPTGLHAELRRQASDDDPAATFAITRATTDIANDTAVLVLAPDTLDPDVTYVSDLQLDTGDGPETWLTMTVTTRLDVTRPAP